MESDLRLARILARILDDQFRLGKFGFGLDAILDLLPVAGDTVVLGLSLFLLILAMRLQIPAHLLFKMLSLVLVCYVIGLIPILGDIAYIAIRPNLRNLKIIEEYLGQKKLV